MKKLIGIMVIISSLALSACSTVENNAQENDEQSVNPKGKVAASDETLKIENENADIRMWEDVSKLEEGMDPEKWSVEHVIANADRYMHQVPDNNSKMYQAGFGEIYYYYMVASSLQNTLQVLEVDGISLEKDFENLRLLTKEIYDEQHNRLDGVDIDFGKNKREAIKYWKEPSERMNHAVVYLQRLLNDLNITINKQGKGKTFGYAYQAGGQKTEELEKFIGH